MKHFLTIQDYRTEELEAIIEKAQKIKANPLEYKNSLEGNVLGLIFEKPSNRTRISFEVGMKQLGGESLYLSPREIQLGKREAIKDVARTMSRFLDVVVLRTFSHVTLTEFAEFASMPIINGLTDFSHPAQAMADYLTLTEKFDDPRKVNFAYIGDGNNVLASLLLLLPRMGVNVSVATPPGFEPNQTVVKHAREDALKTGAKLSFSNDPKATIADADVVYTDVFISMGEEEQKEAKLKSFAEYQLNQELLSCSQKKPLVMHCLPAHRGEEITDEVIESEQSIVFDQAENRLHAQKGILYHLLGGK